MTPDVAQPLAQASADVALPYLAPTPVAQVAPLAPLLAPGSTDESGTFSGIDALAPELVLGDPEAAVAPSARRTRKADIAVADAVGLLVAAVAAALIQTFAGHAPRVTIRNVVLLSNFGRLVVFVPLMALSLGMSRPNWRLRMTFSDQVPTVAAPIAVGAMLGLLLWAAAQFVGLANKLPIDPVLLMSTLALTTVPLARVVQHAPERRLGRSARSVLIIGSGAVAERIADQYAAVNGINVVGFVDNNPASPTRWIGKLEELLDLVEVHDVDHVIVAFSQSSSEEIVHALRPLQGLVPITIIPRFFDVVPATASMHDIGCGIAGITVDAATLGRSSAGVKRLIDIAGAGAGLVLLAPVLLAVALAIKATSRGPVMFKQARVGRHGHEFQILKFRSMYSDWRNLPSRATGQVATGPFPKLKDDPRVTPIGRIIRKYSIDELPQLWNVLVGQMSLVGPRPFIPDDDQWIDGWAARRYTVRPGITGLWQVSGRNDVTFDEMCRLDYAYVATWSVGLDFRILLRTLGAVSSRHGAY